MSSTENTGIFYFANRIFCSSIRLPTLLTSGWEQQVKLGRLFIKNGEYKTFVQSNQSKLKKVDETIAQKWADVAKDPQSTIIKGRLIQVVAAGFETLPLVNLVVGVSSVIGLTASGVAVVIILTPVLVKFTALFFAFTNWDAARTLLTKQMEFFSIKQGKCPFFIFIQSFFDRWFGRVDYTMWPNISLYRKS